MGKILQISEKQMSGAVLWSHSEIEKQFGSGKGFYYLQFKET
ncbi:hypothetical protein [Methanothermobacter thermautotrophicus]|nr:hypothetical protein [Methanothermobacter thermautotrophicus]